MCIRLTTRTNGSVQKMKREVRKRAVIHAENGMQRIELKDKLLTAGNETRLETGRTGIGQQLERCKVSEGTRSENDDK
jgi:hypothetical protein